MAKEFDTVIVCLYWKDILLGYDKEYKKRGWKLVSAGHIFDKYFLCRSRLIFELADCVMSNYAGGLVGNAVYFNKPVYLYRQKHDMTSSVRSEQERMANSSTAQAQMENEIMKEFDVFRDSINVQQREFCNYYFGLDCVRTKEELGNILDDMDRRYQNMIGTI